VTDVTDAPPAEPPDGTDPDDHDGEGADAPRRSRMALVVSLVVAVVVAAFVGVLATREPATDRLAESDLIGKVAPAVEGQTLDGERFDLDNHLGRWVVVNFFATWCRECVVEHPELTSLYRDHAEEGDIALVSVVYDNDPDVAAEFFEERGGGWPVVLDDSGIAGHYGVTKVPETYLVAPSGRVVQKLIGGVTQAGLERIIGDYEAAAASASAPASEEAP
jgi:cytochrome c biogenesis protein CcmG/thiol:disulfide interchange protein DsbE